MFDVLVLLHSHRGEHVSAPLITGCSDQVADHKDWPGEGKQSFKARLPFHDLFLIYPLPILLCNKGTWLPVYRVKGKHGAQIHFSLFLSFFLLIPYRRQYSALGDRQLYLLIFLFWIEVIIIVIIMTVRRRKSNKQTAVFESRLDNNAECTGDDFTLSSLCPFFLECKKNRTEGVMQYTLRGTPSLTQKNTHTHTRVKKDVGE